MQVSHRFTAASAVFDDDHLVSCAGLVPVMELAAQTGLSQLLADKICIPAPKIKSGSANPSPKLTTVIAGMCVGADSIDDLDVVRSGGMKTLFGGVYAPSTVGTLLREFTFGHARQMVGQGLCATMNVVPDHTDQRELLKKLIEEGGPATLEAIAEVVEGSGGSDYFGKTYRDQTGVSALVEVVLGLDSSLPATLEQMLRETRRVQQPDQP